MLLVREWGITLMRFVVKKYGVMPASQGGRIKTTLQSVAIGGYLLPLEIWDTHVQRRCCAGPSTSRWPWPSRITLVTAVQYVRDAVRLRREQKALAREHRRDGPDC